LGRDQHLFTGPPVLRVDDQVAYRPRLVVDDEVGDVPDLAKGGDPVKEDVGVGALVEEVARFDRTGSPVSLDFRQADDLWPALADKGQLQQVISNVRDEGTGIEPTLHGNARPESDQSRHDPGHG
jgi:hypothetical protein